MKIGDIVYLKRGKAMITERLASNKYRVVYDRIKEKKDGTISNTGIIKTKKIMLEKIIEEELI